MVAKDPIASTRTRTDRLAGQIDRAERIHKALPVRIGSAMGVTRDFSKSGVYFETIDQLPEGNPIAFSVEFDGPTGRMELQCIGEVVRTEPGDSWVGIAVKISESAIVESGVH